MSTSKELRIGRLTELLCSAPTRRENSEVKSAGPKALNYSTVSDQLTDDNFIFYDSLHRPNRPNSSKSCLCFACIGPRAFAFSGISQLDLPDGVYAIHDKAFIGCTSLGRLRINPDSRLEEIGRRAFHSSPSRDRHSHRRRRIRKLKHTQRETTPEFTHHD
jgi:hypothetical protein